MKVGLLFAGSLGLFVLVMSPIIGYLTQPWAPWWVTSQPSQTIIVGGDPLGGAPLDPGSPIILPLPGATPAPGFERLFMDIVTPWLGTPYVFGGCLRSGVDCSCFTRIVDGQLGIQLPRTAQAQYNASVLVSPPQFGDLVFFQHTYDSPDRITHVGFYIGGNQMISAIAPTLGRQSLDTPYWRAHFAGFGRPPSAVPPGQG